MADEFGATDFLGDFRSDPQWRAWADHVRDNVVGRILASTHIIAVVPERADDLQFAAEVGLAMMLGRPLILVIAEGRGLPVKLGEVAETVVRYGPTAGPLEQQLRAALRLLPDVDT